MEIIESSTLHTFYVETNNTVIIICPECDQTKVFEANDYMTNNRGIKARCSCGRIFRCAIEFRKSYRKKVNLVGEYINVKNGDRGKMTVESISLGGIDFANLSSSNFIMKNDVLQVAFNLDDRNRTPVERDVKVKSVRKDDVSASFARSQMYDKALGFYLMP